MHPITLLMLATFILVAAFLVWNLLSVKRHRFNRDRTGIGGSNDPLSGKSEGIRPPGELTASLNEASGRSSADHG